MYSAIERQQLINIAQKSIQHGLDMGTRIELDLSQYGYHVKELKATFVTLKIDGLLRGCIGTLSAQKPLIESVAYNAFSAAFHDPRFGALRVDEFPLLQIEISILSAMEAIEFESEQDLIAQLRPGTDGLVITAGEHSATFLPSVWQELSNPADFLGHLKEKAGLTDDEWPAGITAERYTVYTIANHRNRS